MNSPITNKPMKRCAELRKATFREETFEYVHQFYKCEDTSECFTTTDMDTVNMEQIHNQYRAKHGIPLASEIHQTREQYGLSASKMSAVLGFGANQYRLYENGNIPNVSQGRTLKAIQTPETFRSFVENAREVFSEKEHSRVLDAIVSAEKELKERESREQFIFPNLQRPNIYNGYAVPSMGKLKNVMLFFINKMGGVFVTKMNKLLFYADFVAFRELGQSMTGVSYTAIQYGPVPENWNAIYSLTKDIESIPVEYPNAYSGTKLVSEIEFDGKSLSEKQQDILKRVCAVFSETNAKAISQKSHEEEAWINNIEQRTRISFNHAFSIKAL